MLTTLSILSLDQGKIWNDAPVPTEEEAGASLREPAPERTRARRPVLSALADLLRAGGLARG